MYVSIHFLFFCSCLTEYLARADNPKNTLTHRYHPTTFYSGQNDEPDTDTAADDIQYAYEGGESHTGEVTNPQDSDYQASDLQPEVQHDYQSHDDYQPDTHHDYQPDVHHDYLPDIHHDYPVDSGYHYNEHETGYPEHDGYKYNIPEHEFHHDEPSVGYHYLPPPALPAAHALVETPKQTPPQYTYYYLGRHLWYIPLYFSIYFIIYVGALVLKSVARHKIQFPYNLQMAAVQARSAKALEEGSKKFYM